MRVPIACRAGHGLTFLRAMLYAAGVPNREAMKNSPHVGVASVWWEGNPCNMHCEHFTDDPKEELCLTRWPL